MDGRVSPTNLQRAVFMASNHRHLVHSGQRARVAGKVTRCTVTVDRVWVHLTVNVMIRCTVIWSRVSSTQAAKSKRLTVLELVVKMLLILQNA